MPGVAFFLLRGDKPTFQRKCAETTADSRHLHGFKLGFQTLLTHLGHKRKNEEHTARGERECERASHFQYKVLWTVLMCVTCGLPVLLVHLSKKPLQLRTALETCLIISLGVLRERRNGEGMGVGGEKNKAGYS